jgi:hypothetical protein
MWGYMCVHVHVIIQGRGTTCAATCAAGVCMSCIDVGIYVCTCYYTGSGDNVRCYMCGGSLRSWDAEDDPATEHGRWFPKCPYAQSQQLTASETRLIENAVAMGYRQDVVAKLVKLHKRKGGMLELR